MHDSARWIQSWSRRGRRMTHLVAGMLVGIGGPAATVAIAQGPAAAPAVLGAPGSTRALALGDAYAALGSDPDVIFYNPARVVSARGIALAVQQYGGASTLFSLSAASVLAPGTIAVGVQLLDEATSLPSYRALGEAGTRALFARGELLAAGAVVSAAYAQPAWFNTRIGVTGKVVHQQFDRERDVTGAFDIGVSRGSTVLIALVGRNLGHGIRLGGATVSLPREIVLGAAVPRREVGPLDLAAAVSVAMSRDGSLSGGGGTEWAYMPLDGFTFALRAGYLAVEGAESHLTLGGGFVGERVSLDYAVQAPNGAGASHRFGVRWR